VVVGAFQTDAELACRRRSTTSVVMMIVIKSKSDWLIHIKEKGLRRERRSKILPSRAVLGSRTLCKKSGLKNGYR
jgi:hypothetical protein